MIPSKVKVGGIEYTVREIQSVDVAGNYNNWGVCKRDQAVIEIRESLSKDRKEQTFVHELIHAMIYEAGFRNLEGEEDLVERLGIVFHQVLKDNPGLIGIGGPDFETDECDCCKPILIGPEVSS